tara:strand:+ start:892 stop:1377 length:486 start_codon:yes stop_codon:yes gene_type:complete
MVITETTKVLYKDGLFFQSLGLDYPYVEVYRNLRSKAWSIRNPKTGRVILHTEKIYLQDCKLTVQPAGRQRVLDTGQKNVHAFIKGTIDFTTMTHQNSFWIGEFSEHPAKIQQVYYSPYLWDSFVTECFNCGDITEQVFEAQRICLGYDGKVWMRKEITNV